MLAFEGVWAAGLQESARRVERGKVIVGLEQLYELKTALLRGEDDVIMLAWEH
jgi:hypothetical protein